MQSKESCGHYQYKKGKRKDSKDGKDQDNCACIGRHA